MKESYKAKVERITKLLYAEMAVSAMERRRYIKSHHLWLACRADEYISNCRFILDCLENDGEI